MIRSGGWTVDIEDCSSRTLVEIYQSLKDDPDPAKRLEVQKERINSLITIS